MLELVKPLSIKKVFLVSNSVNFKSYPGVAMSLRNSMRMYKLELKVRKNIRNAFWELQNHQSPATKVKRKSKVSFTSSNIEFPRVKYLKFSKPCWRQNSSSKVELFRNQEKRGYSAVATVAASKPQSWLHQPLGIKVKRRWKTWKKIFFEKEKK